MNYLREQTLILIGYYFPVVPRFFGVKILSVCIADLMIPYTCSSNESVNKISYLVKNWWNSPLPIKIIVSCEQEEDSWVQVYPVNQHLMRRGDKILSGGWDKDVSCGEENFDPELGRKRKNTVVPSQGLLEIEHFTVRKPQPRCRCCVRGEPFQVVSEDSSVVILDAEDLAHRVAKIKVWILCSLATIFGVAVTAYLWAHYMHR